MAKSVAVGPAWSALPGGGFFPVRPISERVCRVWPADRPKRAKQAFAAECDMNNKVKLFTKSGMLPPPPGPPLYTDTTKFPPNLRALLEADLRVKSVLRSLSVTDQALYLADPNAFIKSSVEAYKADADAKAQAAADAAAKVKADAETVVEAARLAVKQAGSSK